MLRDAQAAERAGYLRHGDEGRLGAAREFQTDYGFNYASRGKEGGES